MDSPQYGKMGRKCIFGLNSFKPYYKWIVLNTMAEVVGFTWIYLVLNLIING